MTSINGIAGPTELAHEIVSWLGEFASSVSAVDAVLLVLALVIVLLLRASLRAAVSVEPVEVETLGCDPSARADVQALSAFLRERVADSGLPPPPLLPAGAPLATTLAAVAASPIPQASFIAKAVEALPLPQAGQYKLSGTLSKNGTAERLSYWLRSSNRPDSVMKTVKEYRYEEAIEQAAFEVYSYVSTKASRAFPTWTRWRSAEALRAYRAGCDAADSQKWNKAITQLRAASKREPANALIRLQLANVYERRAMSMTRDASRPPRVRAREHARALVSYSKAAHDCHWLAQPRYRASVLAGMLAGMCTEREAVEEARRGIVACLKLTGDRTTKAEHAENANALANEIREWADSQSRALLALLRPWYVLLSDRRLRTQFEPSAAERRQLKRAVRISRKSMKVRSVGNASGRSAWLKLRFAEASVRLLLFFDLTTMDWQTHYVAACFYALLLKRGPGLNGTARQDTLERRGLFQLKHAIESGGPALPVEWANRHDPDLEVLRQSSGWATIQSCLRAMGESPATAR